MSYLELSSAKEDLFNADIRHQIDRWVLKFPADQAQSAVIPALHILQDNHDGWLSKDLMDKLAIYLGMPSISVYEVATFYTMYELEPVGKNKISVCTNISCMLRGSEEIVEHLKQRLGVSFGQTTDDGLVTLKEVECLGACCGAPMLQLNRDYHEHLTLEKIDKLVDGLT
jgi:NADH-quinone oxidoreductase subunit E|tara:strand:- start:2424 stop:2933 length:510 start_codon:yes stop_codon:yes gene_type:complete